MGEGEPLTHGRNFQTFFDRYNIKAADRAEYSKVLEGVRQTVVVDDVRHLVTPLAVPSGHYYLYHNPTAGWRAGWEFVATGSRGFYVTWLKTYSANHRACMDNAPGSNMPPIVGGAVGNQAPGVVPSQLPPAHVLNTFGDVALAAAPYVDLDPNNQPYLGCPFFVPEGVTLQIYQTNVSTVLRVGIGIQEIP